MYLNYKGFEYIETINPEYSHHYIMEYSPNDGDNLYLPAGVNQSLYKDRGEAVLCNHADVNYKFSRYNGKIHITVTSNPYHDTVLELPLYYYKGYICAEQNTGKILEITKSDNQLAEVCINSMEQADLAVWYKGTFIQKLGDLISLLTLIILFIYFLIKKSCRSSIT